MVSTSSIVKWGNSLAVRIPKRFLSELQLGNGSVVELTVIDGSLTIKPVRGSRYTLEDLLAKITPENLHEELDSGPLTGKEVFDV